MFLTKQTVLKKLEGTGPFFSFVTSVKHPPLLHILSLLNSTITKFSLFNSLIEYIDIIMHTNYFFSALALALPVYSLSATARMGCYSEVDSFKNQGPYTYQSPGYCQTECAENGFKVAALSRGNMCYCGNKMPSDSAKVADDKCDLSCSGWPAESCELPTILHITRQQDQF